jgi:hypothetical protein
MITPKDPRPWCFSERLVVLTIVVAASMLLGACSANHHSIFRQRPVFSGLHDHSVTSVDAKQRAILRSKVDDVNRFCSEPGPDVFSVVAQALSASGSFGTTADPKALEAALQAAFSSTEQGSTIPRTQTLNLLRELMFRTCERYLSGAISSIELSVQAIRDQRLIVSILSIEHLTGILMPSPVAISAAGNAATGANGDAIVRLDSARRETDAAAVEANLAKTEFDMVFGEDKSPTCAEVAKAASNGQLTQEQTEKQGACAGAKARLDAARSTLTEKTDHHADLKRLAAGAGLAATTQTAVTTLGGLSQPQADSIGQITSAVERIVSKSFNDDSETLFFCLRSLSSDDLIARSEKVEASETEIRGLQQLREQCLSYLKDRVGFSASQFRTNITAETQRLYTMSADLFEQAWTRLNANLNNPDRKTAFITRLRAATPTIDQQQVDCFSGATAKDAYKRCFIGLDPSIQRQIVSGLW